MLDEMFEATGTPPSIDYLQSKYQFEYYSTMNLAVTDVNNGAIGTSADSDKADAVAGIYTDDNGNVNVVLLQDHTEATTISPAVDMTINLGGHTLSSNDACIDVLSGDLTIDGRLSGSVVEVSGSDAGAIAIRIQESSNVVLYGGSYISECTAVEVASIIFNRGTTTALNCNITAVAPDGYAYPIQSGSILTISNCNITAYSNNVSSCVYNKGSATITNCDITATTTNGTAYSIYNLGSTTITDCDIKAYSNYTYGEGGYGAISVGVSNYGTLTLNNCSVMGTHSGVSNRGTLYVNSGTYEGYGHGGFYFSGDGSGNTAYVRDAVIRQCAMPDGYTDGGAGCNGSGFYIGGTAGNDISVYMDNCDIYGSTQPIVLRGSSGEQNNTLYISNSTISGAMNIRIDNNTHKLYIGTGNNFTVDNTTLPEAVIVTNETYAQN